MQPELLSLRAIDELLHSMTSIESNKPTESEALAILHMIETYQKKETVTIDEKEELRQREATVLALLAKSRYSRVKTEDRVMYKWLKEAISLDEDNPIANDLLARLTLANLKTTFTLPTFPRIRETDNRPTKKKVAEQLRKTSTHLLENEASLTTLLERGLLAALKLKNQELVATYEELKQQKELLENELQTLVNATKEYEASLTGTFYTSIHLDEMNEALRTIEKIAQQIVTILPQEDEQKQEKSALDDLEQMIGLTAVKSKVKQLYYFLQFQKKRKEEGYQFQDDLGLHLILTGNPGTGKTTLARLFAKIYYELGILPRADVVEVNRSHLVGAYVGQTEEKTMAAIDKAIGGVLFIDEAYSLKREGQTGNDYGQTAIDTLVSTLTNEAYQGKFAVILAGYPEEMRQFLWSNPGLRSRFPQNNQIELENYSTKELLQIAEKVAKANDFFLTSSAIQQLEERINDERIDESFGNARTVKNIVLDAIYKKGAQVAQLGEDDISIEQYTVLSASDFTKERLDKESSSALEQLQQLTGLTEIKDEMKKIQAFLRMQEKRKHQGLPIVPLELHAIFTGNSGTGKTTVATLYAKMLKESGLLKRGHLVTCSRADLVAGYTGQTAIKTKNKIREALGGVLFIDEAYSLLSHSPGDFGKEAITTIVDEMTKHQHNLVVVLAGYTDEMRELILSNPGLASRFKTSFSFPNYTADQLLYICRTYAEKYSYKMTEQALQVLKAFINKEKPAGNGRFAVNIAEQAMKQQSFRIIDSNGDEEEMSLISQEDIEAVIQMK